MRQTRLHKRSGSRKANKVGITIITFESTMEKMTKDEQSSIIGGCQAEIDLLVANANVNGADWTDEQWDEWARKYEAACSH